MKKKSHLPFFFFLISIACVCTRCSWHNHHVSVHASKSPVYTSLSLPFALKVIDLRETHDVGHTRNFLGMKIARIFSKEPIDRLLERALKQSYHPRKDADHILEIAIHDCYTRYYDKLFHRKAITDIRLAVTLKTRDNKILFTKDLKASNSAAPWLTFSTNTIAKALNKTLAMTLKEIMTLIESDTIQMENN